MINKQTNKMTHLVEVKGVEKFRGTVQQCLDFYDSVGGAGAKVEKIYEDYSFVYGCAIV